MHYQDPYDDLDVIRDRFAVMRAETEKMKERVQQLAALNGKTGELLKTFSTRNAELLRENAVLRRRLEAMGRRPGN